MATCGEAQNFVNIVQQQDPPNSVGKNNTTVVIDGKQVEYDFSHLEKLSKNQPDRILDSSEFEDHTLTVAIGPTKQTQALFAPVKYDGTSRASRRILGFNQALIANIGSKYRVEAPDPPMFDPTKPSTALLNNIIFPSN